MVWPVDHLIVTPALLPFIARKSRYYELLMPPTISEDSGHRQNLELTHWAIPLMRKLGLEQPPPDAFVLVPTLFVGA